MNGAIQDTSLVSLFSSIIVNYAQLVLPNFKKKCKYNDDKCNQL